MKLLALTRIFTRKKFYEQTSQTMGRRKSSRDLFRKGVVKSTFFNCKRILRCATKFGEDVYYCSITLLLLLSLQIGKSLLWL